MDAHRRHVKSTLQPCSLSHWSVSEAWSYFYTNYSTGSVDAHRKHVEFTTALFTFTPMSRVSGCLYAMLDQCMHAGSMLSLHYRLVHFYTGQWVEPQVILVLHWIRKHVESALVTAFFTFSPVSGVVLWVVYVRSMLNLHHSLLHFHMGQWVEPPVIFILHWVSGCI